MKADTLELSALQNAFVVNLHILLHIIYYFLLHVSVLVGHNQGESNTRGKIYKTVLTFLKYVGCLQNTV
jgi:hypothetical protein